MSHRVSRSGSGNPHPLSQFRLERHTDGNRLPVQEREAAGHFDRVPNGVTEVQNLANATLAFILPNDVGLDLDAARHEAGQCFSVPFEWRDALEPSIH